VTRAVQVLRLAPALAAAALLPGLAIAQDARVPLVDGLQIVSAVSRADQGDYESIKDVHFVSEGGFDVAFTADMPGGSRSGGIRHVLLHDLAGARQYALNFHGGENGARPGTTAIGTSRIVIEELRRSGTADFGVWAPGRDGKNDYLYRGQLTRVGREPFDLLVDQKPARLPSIRARARLRGGDWWTSLFGMDAEFWFLDDPENPLCLRFRLGRIGQLDVTQLAHSKRNALNGDLTQTRPPTLVEQELSRAREVRIYGVYFEFASDRIRPQSEAVLIEIAEALRRHPSWRLRIEGHTDGIGSDEENLLLSRRRADAVKLALVERYSIAPSRLTTSGFGRLHPVDTNDTIRGRSLNRRVELIRE
jgi:outer membrane protein OmpA-like peptidoglycan-associated protein